MEFSLTFDGSRINPQTVNKAVDWTWNMLHSGIPEQEKKLIKIKEKWKKSVYIYIKWNYIVSEKNSYKKKSTEEVGR